MGNAVHKHGLHVNDSGTIELNGTPFYGMGTNMFHTFIRNVGQPDRKVYQEDFALVQKYGLPFVRIPFSGWDCGLYRIYETDPETYFTRMDEIVAEAEKRQVGIIASLMWMESGVPCYKKEKRYQIGNPESQTVAFAKQYTADIVKRYLDRPGIWGWEIGNEYNLTADLCNPNSNEYLWPNISTMPHGEINGFDFYTSRELTSFYYEIASEIRKYDSYRMITSGNGDMREMAKSLKEAAEQIDQEHLWKMDFTFDSLDGFYEMNAYYHPDPMDTICFHLQHGSNLADDSLCMKRWGRKDVTTLEYFKAYMEAAKREHKGLFYGEFGDLGDREQADDFADRFSQIVEWISEAGIQLAASWQFTYKEDYIWVNDTLPNDRFKLECIGKENEKYRRDGKQNLKSAW